MLIKIAKSLLYIHIHGCGDQNKQKTYCISIDKIANLTRELNGESLKIECNCSNLLGITLIFYELIGSCMMFFHSVRSH